MRDTVNGAHLRSQCTRGGEEAGREDDEHRATLWWATLVLQAGKGNQPISRRVDTISKQYQDDPEED
ncbi:hypothetical protein GCM10010211_82910 [Streptomyces albospinus]|uniref:Uncharacterized protein n=1 Tax=Streptomyces albospinus TaxID=285515 RepID=A0ABQ2VNQ6_9ACTN|nr:hypothetical protein GCM10010211_82910 [Streptomyces albospinus]